MKLKLTAALMLLVASAVHPAEPGTDPAGDSSVTFVYDFYFGGFRAAEMKITAVFGPDSYQATGHFETRGFVSLFDDTTLKTETVGKLGAGGLIPLVYRSDEREDKDKQFVEVSFSENGPSAVHAAPAFKERPWSIQASEQRGVLDPLSAVLTTLAPRHAGEICGRRIEAFDGRHRFAFDIAPAELNGETIQCKGLYIRLAGYKPKNMQGSSGRKAFTIDLVERPEGGFQVVRLVSPTEYGVAVMRLRD